MALSGKYIRVKVEGGYQYIPLFTKINDMNYDTNGISIIVDGNRYYAAITDTLAKRSDAYFVDGTGNRQYLALYAGNSYTTTGSTVPSDAKNVLKWTCGKMSSVYPNFYKDMTDLPNTWVLCPSGSSGSSGSYDLTSTFEDCECLRDIKNDSMTNFTNTPKSYSWKYTKMFRNCKKLVVAPSMIFNCCVDTSYMYENCESLTSVSSPTFNKSVKCDYMYHNCKSLASISVSLPTVLAAVESSGYGPMISAVGMFEGCESAKTISSSGKGLYVTDYTNIFKDCKNATSISLILNPIICTTMESCFENCESLSSITNSWVSGATTTTVQNFTRTFKNCKALKNLGTTYIVTTGATNMQEMFYGCSSLATTFPLTLDMSSMITSTEEDKFKDMFTGSSVTTLNVTGVDSGALDEYKSIMKTDGDLTINYV